MSDLKIVPPKSKIIRNRDGRGRFWHNDMEAVIGIVVVLLILGTINVFSSSFIMAENNYGTPYHFLYKHLLNLVVGLVAIGVSMLFDYHKWKNFMPVVLFVTIILLVAVLLVGTSINGAKRWLFGVQPAEIAKLVAIMMTAAMLSNRIKNGLKINIFNVQLAIIVILAVLVELEPDMGTCMIIFGIPLILTCIAGLDLRKIAMLVPVGILFVAAMCLYQPYRLQRLMVWFDPWADAENIGYQTVRSLTAIGSGGLWGMGLGKGIAKYEYLPEAHTDFAFAVFAQENGFFFVLFVLVLYAMLAFYGARIAKDAQDLFGRMLAIGMMLLIVCQGVANIAMVCGLLPVVGVPLPFISYGGSSLIVSMFAIGLLIRVGYQGELHRREIFKQQRIDEIQQKPKERPKLRLVRGMHNQG